MLRVATESRKKSNYLFFKGDSCNDIVKFILGIKILERVYDSSHWKKTEQHINLLKLFYLPPDKG
jgi:hypothetical protein